MWPNLNLNLNLNDVRVSGCGALVQWLPPSAGGEARGRHRPGPAGDVAAVAIVQVWLIEATRCVSPQLQATRLGRAGAAY